MQLSKSKKDEKIPIWYTFKKCVIKRALEFRIVKKQKGRKSKINQTNKSINKISLICGVKIWLFYHKYGSNKDVTNMIFLNKYRDYTQH